MIRLRALLHAALLLSSVLAAGCTQPPASNAEGRPLAAGRAPQAAIATPAPAVEALPLTLEEVTRPSPAAALVADFAAVCAEPEPRPMARAASRRGFEPVGHDAGPDGAVWRRPPETAGAATVRWDAATATCEFRVQGADPAVVGAEFARLQPTLESEGATVARLQPPPARFGKPGPRLMLLVTPAWAPAQARVLRFGDDPTVRGGIVLSARRVAPPG